MGYLIFFVILFVIAVMLLNPAGRIILLVMFLLVAIPAGIFTLILLASNKSSEAATSSETTPVASVDNTAGAPLVAPPAPDLKQVEDGVDALEASVADKGFAGAVELTMKCYSDLHAAPKWGSWDRCAALDEYGLQKFEPIGQTTAQYFSRGAVDGREKTAIEQLSSDYNANSDRMAAIQGIVGQAVASIPLRAAQRWAAANPPPPPVRPSFDCSRVRIETLRLVCSNASLTQADNELANAYRLALAKTPDRAGLVASEAQWIKFRNEGAADVDTMTASYLARTRELRIIAGQEAPDRPYDPHKATELSLEAPPNK